MTIGSRPAAGLPGGLVPAPPGAAGIATPRGCLATNDSKKDGYASVATDSGTITTNDPASRAIGRYERDGNG